jgi:hypothetical protein
VKLVCVTVLGAAVALSVTPMAVVVWEFGPPGDVPVRVATLFMPSADLVAAEG